MTGGGLDGKRVVVVGGASGIGFAVARLARAEGAAVVVGSRLRANVDAAVARLGGATAEPIDVRDEASVAAFFQRVGPFDHLAITAGDWDRSMAMPASAIDLDVARNLFEVRFWGAVAVTKRASRTIARDGSITLTSGVLAHRPRKGAPLATALGGAVEHLMRGLAIDLAPVRVNAVSPGLVLTEHVLEMPEDRRRATVAALPIARAATPGEAAAAYAYCMRNGYVTGQVLSVDGGGLLI